MRSFDLDVLHCSPLYPLFEVILYTTVCALLLNILVTCKTNDIMLLLNVRILYFNHWNLMHYNYYYIFSTKTSGSE